MSASVFTTSWLSGMLMLRDGASAGASCTVSPSLTSTLLDASHVLGRRIAASTEPRKTTRKTPMTRRRQEDAVELRGLAEPTRLHHGLERRHAGQERHVPRLPDLAAHVDALLGDLRHDDHDLGIAEPSGRLRLDQPLELGGCHADGD